MLNATAEGLGSHALDAIKGKGRRDAISPACNFAYAAKKLY
jgi:hypothetical protein